MLWTVTEVKETVRPDYFEVNTGEPLERQYAASYLDDGSRLQLLSARA